jgi:hypothetical protein
MIQSTIQKLWYNVTIHIFNIFIHYYDYTFCVCITLWNIKLSPNIRRGFRNNIDDILANYGDSDLICLQECCHMDTNLVEYLEKLPLMDFFVPVLFSELILWKSLALYLGLSDLATSCATAALFTGLERWNR